MLQRRNSCVPSRMVRCSEIAQNVVGCSSILATFLNEANHD